MIAPWASTSLRAPACALLLAWLPACASEASGARSPVVDRIVIGASQSPDPARKVAVDPTGSGVRIEQEPPSPPEPAAVALGEPPAPPLDPGLLDERPGALRARPKALLVAELQTLEALFASIEKSSPDRPKVARRLADVYAELAACAEREAASGSPSGPSGASALMKVKAAARDKSIQYYTLLAGEFPTFCDRSERAAPSVPAGCADEVFYYIGYEEQRAGRLDRARKAYFQLIKMFPESKLLPHAYFAFGEAFYDMARSDPANWSLAAQFYEKALQFNGSRLKPYAYERLRLVCSKMRAIGGDAPAICSKIQDPSAVKAGGGDDGQ